MYFPLFIHSFIHSLFHSFIPVSPKPPVIYEGGVRKTNNQRKNTFLLLCVSCILDTCLFLLVDVKLLEDWNPVSLIFVLCLPDLAYSQLVEQMMSISSTSFWDFMIEDVAPFSNIAKAWLFSSIHTPTSFSKLGPKLIDNYLWNVWVSWGNQVVTLNSQPEFISGVDSVTLSWFLFTWCPEAMVSQERSFSFESSCDSCWVK